VKNLLLVLLGVIAVGYLALHALQTSAVRQHEASARRYAMAQECAALDPNVTNWIYDAAMGRAVFVANGGEHGDDGADGLAAYSCQYATIAVHRRDGAVVTNDYVLRRVEHYENGAVSNFQSRAAKLVAELVDGMKEQCPL